MKPFQGMYKNIKYTFMMRKKGTLYPIDIKIGIKSNETFSEFRIKEKKLDSSSHGYPCEALDSSVTYEIVEEKQEQVNSSSSLKE
jgi:hypothetical protein